MSAFFSRCLSLAGDDPAEADRLRVLRLYLMAHVAFELLWDTLIWESQRAYYGLAFSTGLLVCLGLTFAAGRTVLAVRLFVGFHLGAIVWLFPAVSNHFFLVFFALLLLSIVDLDQPREALLGLQACRFLVVVVLFYSGLQKVLYGTYFHAQLLTWTIAHDSRFATAFGALMPAAEAARIDALTNTRGPFASEWWLLLLVSNFTYLFELVAPALLLWRRTRVAAVAAVFVFMVLIEAGAREYLFGAVYLNLLFLFTRKSWYRVTLPLTLLLYAWLLYPRLERIGSWF